MKDEDRDHSFIDREMRRLYEPPIRRGDGAPWTWCRTARVGKAPPCAGDELCMCVECLSFARLPFIEAVR